jgi:hypothetical protein
MKVEFISLSFESANTRRYFVFWNVRRKKILNLSSPFSLRKKNQSKSKLCEVPGDVARFRLYILAEVWRHNLYILTLVTF